MPDTIWDSYQSAELRATRTFFHGRPGLIQIVNYKTTKRSCLDLVLVSEESLIGAIDGRQGMEGFSNHIPEQ